MSLIIFFLVEILSQLIFGILCEWMLYSVRDSFKKTRNPFLTTIGYLLWGAFIGLISLWIFPTSYISNPNLRLLNLIITPTVFGCVLLIIGKIRERKGQDKVELDHFGYAFAFAFSMSLVRLIWCQVSLDGGIE